MVDEANTKLMRDYVLETSHAESDKWQKQKKKTKKTKKKVFYYSNICYELKPIRTMAKKLQKESYRKGGVFLGSKSSLLEVDKSLHWSLSDEM